MTTSQQTVASPSATVQELLEFLLNTTEVAFRQSTATDQRGRDRVHAVDHNPAIRIVSVDDKPYDGDCNICDASPHGLCVIHTQNLPIGAKIKFEFVNTKNQRRQADAVVKNSTPTDDTHRIGLRFVL